MHGGHARDASRAEVDARKVDTDMCQSLAQGGKRCAAHNNAAEASRNRRLARAADADVVRYETEHYEAAQALATAPDDLDADDRAELEAAVDVAEAAAVKAKENANSYRVMAELAQKKTAESFCSDWLAPLADTDRPVAMQAAKFATDHTRAAAKLAGQAKTARAFNRDAEADAYDQDADEERTKAQRFISGLHAALNREKWLLIDRMERAAADNGHRQRTPPKERGAFRQFVSELARAPIDALGDVATAVGETASETVVATGEAVIETAVATAEVFGGETSNAAKEADTDTDKPSVAPTAPAADERAQDDEQPTAAPEIAPETDDHEEYSEEDDADEHEHARQARQHEDDLDDAYDQDAEQAESSKGLPSSALDGREQQSAEQAVEQDKSSERLSSSAVDGRPPAEPTTTSGGEPPRLTAAAYTDRVRQAAENTPEVQELDRQIADADRTGDRARAFDLRSMRQTIMRRITDAASGYGECEHMHVPGVDTDMEYIAADFDQPTAEIADQDATAELPPVSEWTDEQLAAYLADHGYVVSSAADTDSL